MSSHVFCFSSNISPQHFVYFKNTLSTSKSLSFKSQNQKEFCPCCLSLNILLPKHSEQISLCMTPSPHQTHTQINIFWRKEEHLPDQMLFHCTGTGILFCGGRGHLQFQFLFLFGKYPVVVVSTAKILGVSIQNKGILSLFLLSHEDRG